MPADTEVTTTIPLDSPDGDHCLSFEISGPWGHFRRIEGNIVKQTYKTIPRTTLAGLVAAILGIGRNEYYELFSKGESAIAIEPTSELRTMKLPMNTLSTAEGDVKTVPRGRQKVKIGLPNPAKARQQHNYEVLVEPSYRVDIWLSNQSTYKQLHEALEAGQSHYVPSLGLSEHLAEIEFLGEFPINRGTSGQVEVDSIVPEYVDSIVPERGKRYELERWPGFMEAIDGGRRTTEFISVAYNPDGESLTVSDIQTAQVEGREVLFT